jgi:hypothetical protein
LREQSAAIVAMPGETIDVEMRSTWGSLANWIVSFFLGPVVLKRLATP